MTPEEDAMMRARLSGEPAPAPAKPGLYERLQSSGQRLADNPIARSAGLGLVSPLAAPLLGAATQARTALSLDPVRQPTAFTRDDAGGPAPTELRPMPDMQLTMPETPALAPGYGRPGSSGGGTSGGGLGALAASYRDAQNNQFRAFNTEQDLVEHRGELQEQRVSKQAELQELDAARKIRDAEVKAQHDAEIGAKHEAFLARNQQLADDIGAQKIDPSKVMGDKSAGEKVMMLIAGALSGAAGQGPQFMARLDNMVDQGVKAQIANAEGKKAQLSARQSLFQQMMAESGDKKVAEAQTRQLIYTAVQQKMTADAERLGIPELKVNADLMRNQIDEQKINPLRVQMTGDQLRVAQQQAAQAAAAQRAAEEKAYQRSKDAAEFGLKVDAQSIERAKLEKGEKDDINAETAKLGAALADPKLANGRAAVENSKRRLGMAEDGTAKLDKDGKPVVDLNQGLPGVGPLADFREKIAGRPQGANALNPMAWVTNKVAGLNDDERVARGDWDKMALAYQVQVTGSGGSEEQMRQIRSAFAGAKTAKEQRNAVAEADAVFRQIESNHKASVSPRALQTFEARINGVAPSMPSQAQVKR